MLNPELINDDVRSDIMNRMNIDQSNMTMEQYAEAIARISRMSVYEAFDEYLNWNGIIGYTGQFIRALDSIRASEKAKT